ncbi:hypothetical protein GCM10019059_40810 [Camelimonas fluminis]|nr:hypothetical protein GCM10019059_40810 [Camelimonas fluminis]
MAKHFRVLETIQLVHFIDAESEDEAKRIAESRGPLDPDPAWDTDILKAVTRTVEVYDPEG